MTTKEFERQDPRWLELGDDFAPIERRFFTGASLTAQQVLTGGASMKECRLVVGRRHGVAERAHGGVRRRIHRRARDRPI